MCYNQQTIIYEKSVFEIIYAEIYRIPVNKTNAKTSNSQKEKEIKNSILF